MQQRCPICGTSVSESSRYPRHLCATCAAKVRSADGRSLTFANAHLSGGFVARYADTGEGYPSHECFVDGVKCHADEAYLGGIVIEAANAISGRIVELLGEAKRLAQEYRTLSGKPLGITGEVAEYEAHRILGVELSTARQAGYDATEVRDGVTRRLQIKGRCILDNSKPGQRVGSIDVKKEWDAVLLVLLDQRFEATHIFEAERPAVLAALAAPGGKARNERGALSVSKFKSIGILRWARRSAA